MWPVSRSSRPKQFLKFGTEHSLLQNTLLRCQAELFDDRPIIVGAKGHRFLIAQDLQEIGMSSDIVLEPVARSSCAAIAVACLQAERRAQEAIVLVLAADHHIPERGAFVRAVEVSLDDVAGGNLMTFGITPDHPATGYGYILPGERLVAGHRIDRFIEKPDRVQAEELVASGYLWNSGNFLFRADAFLAELQRRQPDVLAAVSAALDKARTDLDFLRLDEEAFCTSPRVAVDNAIFERTEKAGVLPVDYDWSDIGSWDELTKVLPADANENVTVGDAAIVDGRRNVVHSDGKLTALLGVDDLAVISTRDVVLVTARSRAQDVRSLVGTLTASGRSEANEAMQIFRPWGNYERLESTQGYQVKRITVNPGGVLSLQSHQHRAEHWVVVDGCAEATIEDAVCTLEANQSIYVPAGSRHRLANRGNDPLVLIEVQTGTYLGEDDITRFDDVYGR
ncbi:MAG: mannose-1-phosphate guanylyltransferase/mannose-6-phosphate isomerase [Rhizobiales bacterium]|nr:mannose-1-phosphate guanylyltransferase/mannose-6-phosphate isomerase [Hyphomicrobiales bacterium]